MKVYVDTSVIGGCFDDEFKQWSNLLVEEFKVSLKALVLSDLVTQEIQLAKDNVRNKLIELQEINHHYFKVDIEAIKLAETFIVEGALTNKSFNDALHIALATINNVDVLASWNFKHIVNITRIRGYNSVNIKSGH